ncbi:MAG: efflux RND transporter periplasmic adaptor subunit [Roseivirga sp.]|nr:efflux RND transporter periplasmic adaptor subunit [Roseivirga sp.]
MKTLLWSILILALGATAWFFVIYQPQNERQASVDYTAVPASRQDIGTYVLATGIVKPQTGAEVRIGAQVSGVVQKLHVSIGDRVEKGDLLAEIDPAQFIANRDQALAILKNAEAGLAYIESNFDRQTKLFKDKVISADEYDLAKRNLAIAQAELERQQANVRLLETQLSLTWVYATISGVVASVSTQEGETVISSFSSATFVTIIDLNRLEVWAYVDETDIGRIRKAQQATFTVDTYPDIDFSGVVREVYPQAELKDNVVNYITVIEIEKSETGTLRPEMTATLNIIQDIKPEVVAVPNRAIKREGNARRVYVKSGETIEKRTVQIGARDGKFTEVISGVKVGERVILEDIKIE